MILIKRFKIIFSIQAVLILLLHGFTPHNHRNEPLAEKHQLVYENTADIIDYLGLVFHCASGESLKNYVVAQEKAESETFCNSLITSKLELKKPFFLLESQGIERAVHNNKPNYILANALRAPPVFS